MLSFFSFFSFFAKSITLGALIYQNEVKLTLSRRIRPKDENNSKLASPTEESRNRTEIRILAISRAPGNFFVSRDARITRKIRGGNFRRGKRDYPR